MHVFLQLTDYLLVLLCVTVLYRLLCFLWSVRHIHTFSKTVPNGFSFFSTIYKLRGHGKNALHLFDELYNHTGTKTAFVWLGIFPTLFTYDTDLVSKILLSPNLINKSILYKGLHDIFDGGLPFLNDRVWYKHRKALNPLFHQRNLLNLFAKFNKAKDYANLKFNELADDGKEHALLHLIDTFTLRLSYDSLFGVELTSDILSELTPHVVTLLDHCMYNMLLSSTKLQFAINFDRKFQQTKSILYKFVMNGILNYRSLNSKFNGQSPTEPNDETSIEKVSPKFFDHMQHLYEKQEFDAAEIHSEACWLVGAAFDTSSRCLYSVIMLLAMHPDIQERTFAEVLTVFPDKEFHFEYQHIKELPYLQMVINETLRLFPTVPIIARGVRTDTEITENCTLPKGLQLVISLFHFQRQTDIWGDDANQFNPDHFLAEKLRSIPPTAFSSFSRGPRNCIGFRYAYQSITAILAKLIRNYRFETNFKYEDIELMATISLLFKREPNISIHSR